MIAGVPLDSVTASQLTLPFILMTVCIVVTTDVYKRQVIMCFIKFINRSFFDSLILPLTRICCGRICRIVASMMLLLVPVSYTHLDVYKRQMLKYDKLLDLGRNVNVGNTYNSRRQDSPDGVINARP